MAAKNAGHMLALEGGATWANLPGLDDEKGHMLALEPEQTSKQPGQAKLSQTRLSGLPAGLPACLPACQPACQGLGCHKLVI